MTNYDTVQAIKALGLIARYSIGEFRVSFPVAHYMAKGDTLTTARLKAESTAYYTDCADDALGTARAMLEGELV